MKDLLKKYKQYPNTWDEMFDSKGNIRNVYRDFGSYLKKTDFDNLTQMRDFSSQFFKNQGITFTVYNDNKGVERIFPFDIIPRIIEHNEWRSIESGIIQRIKALNLFLRDIYHEQFIVKDNIISGQLIFNNKYFIREMINLSVPKDIYTHISGVDLVRGTGGELFVLEDNLRTPSGVSYMLENREITRRLYPNLMPKHKVLSVDNYPQVL